MAVYRTTFPIDASAAQVWAILTDFDRWAEWNPSVPSIEGEARVGSTLSLKLAMPGRPSARVKAELTELAFERRLAWHGNIGSDRIFSGRREFSIEPQHDGTVRVTHVEDIGGVLFPVFRAVMGDAIQQHHEGLNEALKERAEGRR